MDNLLGKNLGRYQVIEPLGQGGMASVYKAFDTTLERNVAIKIIRTDRKEGTEQNEFLKRFQREAKALAQLDHPYILKVLDYGEQEGMPYLVMPFVRGGTLKEKMGRPMPYQEAAALLAPIAQALEYAHQRKIIHRDVKPANILIGETKHAAALGFWDRQDHRIRGIDPADRHRGRDRYARITWHRSNGWEKRTRARIFMRWVLFSSRWSPGALPYSAETPAAVLIKHMQDPLPRPKSFVPALPDAVEQVIFKR